MAASPLYDDEPFTTILTRSYVEPQTLANFPFTHLSPKDWFMYTSPNDKRTLKRNADVKMFVDTAGRIVKKVKRGGLNAKSDIFVMVQLAIEYGDDLLLPPADMFDEQLNNFTRLKRTYGLVSHSPRLPDTVNLSTVAELFPVATCMFVRYFARTMKVPHSRMIELSPNYPRVMMTSAFAYLVPMQKEPFCITLLKAHMLHQFEMELAIATPCLTAERDSLPIATAKKIIEKVIQCTRVAGKRSRVTIVEKFKFIIAYELVGMFQGQIVPRNNVIEAAKVWNLLITKYYKAQS